MSLFDKPTKALLNEWIDYKFDGGWVYISRIEESQWSIV